MEPADTMSARLVRFSIVSPVERHRLFLANKNKYLLSLSLSKLWSHLAGPLSLAVWLMRFISQGHPIPIPIPGKRQTENNENLDKPWEKNTEKRCNFERNLNWWKLPAAQGVKDQRGEEFAPPHSQIIPVRGICKVILSLPETLCLPRIGNPRSQREQGDADLSGLEYLSLVVGLS